MGKTIAELEELWDGATEDAKKNYLFQAVCHINSKLEDKFVTKKQALVGVGVIFVAMIAFSLGAGLITFDQAVNMMKP